MGGAGGHLAESGQGLAAGELVLGSGKHPVRFHQRLAQPLGALVLGCGGDGAAPRPAEGLQMQPIRPAIQRKLVNQHCAHAPPALERQQPDVQQVPGLGEVVAEPRQKTQCLHGQLHVVTEIVDALGSK